MALQRAGNSCREPLQEATASALSCCTAQEISLQDGGGCSFPSHTALPLAMSLAGLGVGRSPHHTTVSSAKACTPSLRMSQTTGSEERHVHVQEEGFDPLWMVAVKEGLRCNTQ